MEWLIDLSCLKVSKTNVWSFSKAQKLSVKCLLAEQKWACLSCLSPMYFAVPVNSDRMWAASTISLNTGLFALFLWWHPVKAGGRCESNYSRTPTLFLDVNDIFWSSLLLSGVSIVDHTCVSAPFLSTHQYLVELKLKRFRHLYPAARLTKLLKGRSSTLSGWCFECCARLH